MQASQFNPVMLLAGMVILALQVRIVSRGSVSIRLGKIEREKDPAVFWLVVAVNVMLGAVALLMGLGVFKK